MKAPTKEALSEGIEQGFSSLETLWNGTRGVTEITGLDTSHVGRVKENIRTAYEAMSEARQQLQSN